MNQFRPRKQWLAAACIAAACAGCNGKTTASIQPKDSASGLVELRVLSNRADIVSAGDALVEVLLPAGADASTLRTELGSADVSEQVQLRDNGRVMGLVTGLALGDNLLTARLADGRGATIHIVNHPIGGPVFSGPQIQPWTCADGVEDDQCNRPPTYEFMYKSSLLPSIPDAPLVGASVLRAYDPANPPGDVAMTTTDNGATVPFIVRVETGVIDRDEYRIAVLYDPSLPWEPWAPQAGYNGKLVIFHGASCDTAYEMADAPDVINDAALSRGFITMSHALNNAGHNCNIATQAEAMIMTKEYLVDHYGELRYTIGSGCSGGSLVQQQVANAYPGFYQGITPQCSFTDAWSSSQQYVDYVGLRDYFEHPLDWAPGVVWDPLAIAAVEGHPNPVNPITFTEVIPYSGDPSRSCPGVPTEDVFDENTNPTGVRCSLQDYMVNVFGRRDEDGYAQRPFDNVGIQYGLKGLMSGALTPAQFVDLNSKLQAQDINANPIGPGRVEADRPALGYLYRTGAIDTAQRLNEVAIIDLRGPDPGAFHDVYRTYVMRARLLRNFSTAANQILWRGTVPLLGDVNYADQAILAVDQWLTAVEADTRDVPLSQKILQNIPASVQDRCTDGAGHDVPATICDVLVQAYSSPRIEAGAPLTDDVMKCQLKPLVREEYLPVTFTDDQWTALQATFPAGVCDYSQPPVDATENVPWLTYANGPGGEPMGETPKSVAFGPGGSPSPAGGGGSGEGAVRFGGALNPLFLIVALIAFFARPGAANAAVPIVPDDAHLSTYVVPLAGTWPPGFVNPGPFAPFGMVNPGPDTEGPLNYGGYSYQNSLITGFSQVHMSAGVFKGGQIPIMPVGGNVTAGDLADIGYPSAAPAYASAFSHLVETAQAGYYKVNLLRYNINAEVTATERASLYRFTWHLPTQKRLVFAIGRELGGRRFGSATLRPDGVLVGAVRTSDNYNVYFAARFNAPYTVQRMGGGAVGVGQTVQGDALGVVLTFNGLTGPLLTKLAISHVDADGALRNLDAEIPGWNFDAVRAAAQAKWDAALSRITVTGGTLAQRQSFYTALSRVQQFPNLLSDVDGRYPGPDDQIHTGTRPHYTQFSLWDSYRGQNQVLAEIVPGIYRDMVGSLLDFHRQGGALPRWQQAQRDAGHMSGDPVIPFIAESLCRGNIGTGAQPELLDAMQSLASRRLADLQQGYLPVPVPTLAEELQGGTGRAGTTLEYGIADFALALTLKSSRPAAAVTAAQRSLNYRNLFDPNTRFIRPRHADGSWLKPFLPELGYGFQEGTSWQYTWLAMHDYAGLIERMGPARMQKRLDLFFGFPLDAGPLAVPTLQNTITAFGTTYYGNQYAPGNEHDLEAPYVYSYLGMPWKTQITARAAASIYAPTPLGLPGNDDLGALSGWLVWTMLGVYPINPGTPLYVIGAPHFNSVTIRRPSGNFTIATPGLSPLFPFVTRAMLDGVVSTRSWFVMPRAASRLELGVNSTPEMSWGAAPADLPPSLSTHTLGAFGCVSQ